MADVAAFSYAARLNRWTLGLPLAVLLLGVSLFMFEPLPVVSLRLAGFDLYQRWQPRVVERALVRVIDIDEASLQKLGQWPWPRTRIAELIEQLSARGAAAVVFDVMFAEPDRTSPSALIGNWPLSPATRAELAALPDHDQRLAEALRDRPVVLAFALRRGAGSAGLADKPDGPWRYVEHGEPNRAALHAFDGVVPALPVLAGAASGYGAMDFVPDQDGVVRRVPLVLALNGRPVPTLVAEALRVALGERVYRLRYSEQPGGGVEALQLGLLMIPLSAEGELWLHYSPIRPDARIAAWRLFPALAGSQPVPDEDIAGRIVLIGSSAQGLMDLRFSPLGTIIPGVEAHAQALEQILSNHRLQRPNWAAGVELLTLLAASLLLAAGGLGLPALRAALLAGLLVLALFAGSWWLFVGQGLLLDATLPALVALAVYLCASVIRHLAAERQQRYLKTAFARYISPNRVEHLLHHPEALALGGERRVCSFVFTDLAGFTTLMETLDPAQAVQLLNDYLDGMVGIAFAHQGTLDRIVGDAVAVLFSAPLPQPDHARRALDCALAMLRFSEEYAATQQAKGIPFGHTRIGVHSGEVIVGNFGGSTLFDYRALGDAVNTASRLESVNKHLGTHICVSEACLAGCGEVQSRPIGALVLKGKQQALRVYEPFTAERAARSAALLADYQAAWALLAARYPDDGLIAFQLRRLQAGEQGERIVMSEK